MNFLIFILIILLYAVLGAVTAGLLIRFTKWVDGDEDIEVVLTVFFWPLVLPVMGLIKLLHLIICSVVNYKK